MRNNSIRKELIRSHLDQLSRIFPMQKPIVLDKFKRQHRAHDYPAMIQSARESMNLELRVRVGLVNSGGPSKAPAWVSRPTPMPAPGTLEIRRTTATVYLRKSFLKQNGFPVVMMAIAHELAHLALDSTNHPLRDSEEAVDLTAMLLGYRDVYLAGGRYNEIRARSVQEFVLRQLKALLLRTEIREFCTIGYLSPEEIQFAGSLLGNRTAKTFDPSVLGYAVLAILFRAACVGALVGALIWIIPSQ